MNLIERYNHIKHTGKPKVNVPEFHSQEEALAFWILTLQNVFDNFNDVWQKRKYVKPASVDFRAEELLQDILKAITKEPAAKINITTRGGVLEFNFKLKKMLKEAFDSIVDNGLIDEPITEELRNTLINFGHLK